MYTYLKACHLISVIAWFAGLFYIFRLFVYHVKNQHNPEICRTFEVMESKLLNIIMTPAMVLTIFFGIWIFFFNSALHLQTWFQLKFLAVFCLLAYHFFARRVRLAFGRGNFFLSERQCRLINEIPTVLLIVIVLLAVVKPWMH